MAPFLEINGAVLVEEEWRKFTERIQYRPGEAQTVSAPFDVRCGYTEGAHVILAGTQVYDLDFKYWCPEHYQLLPTLQMLRDNKETMRVNMEARVGHPVRLF